MENQFIAVVVASRKAFDYAEARSGGRIEQMLSPQAAQVYELCRRYYSTDEDVAEVPRAFLKTELKTTSASTKVQEMLDMYVENMPHEEASPENVARLFLETKKQSVRVSLAEALLNNEEEQAHKYLEQYNGLSNVAGEKVDYDQYFQNVMPSQLLEEQEKVKHYQIELAPSSLNERIGGGAVRGNHIVVIARPETGKTLFAVDNMAHFLEQDLRCLYLGNEEPVHLTLSRLHTRLTGMDSNQIRKNPKLADKALAESNFGNLVAVGIPGAGLSAIEALVQQTRPDVVIVDQLRNVKCNGESKTLQLETVARGLRELALKHNCLMISITQAGDSASNKLVLEMGDVDYSNTGIPGAADLIVGIGVNYDYAQADMRMLSLCKNKLSSRHEHFAVSVDTRFHRMGVVE